LLADKVVAVSVSVVMVYMQRQRRVHKERLMNEFTSALSSFQSAQRLEKEREKQCISRSHHVAVSDILFFTASLFTSMSVYLLGLYNYQ